MNPRHAAALALVGCREKTGQRKGPSRQPESRLDKTRGGRIAASATFLYHITTSQDSAIPIHPPWSRFIPPLRTASVSNLGYCCQLGQRQKFGRW